MAKRIICKNEDGVQVEFNYSFEPFFLVSVDGIYTVSNNVVTSENTMVDGSHVSGKHHKTKKHCNNGTNGTRLSGKQGSTL